MPSGGRNEVEWQSLQGILKGLLQHVYIFDVKGLLCCQIESRNSSCAKKRVDGGYPKTRMKLYDIAWQGTSQWRISQTCLERYFNKCSILHTVFLFESSLATSKGQRLIKKRTSSQVYSVKQSASEYHPLQTTKTSRIRKFQCLPPSRKVLWSILFPVRHRT